jgi:hypothetical protein
MLDFPEPFLVSVSDDPTVRTATMMFNPGWNVISLNRSSFDPSLLSIAVDPRQEFLLDFHQSESVQSV